MEAFLVAFVFVGMLMAGGMWISLSLYHSGVLGQRRFTRSPTFATEPMYEEEREDQSQLNTGVMEYGNLGYARKELMFLFGCGVMILAAVMSVFGH